MKTCPNINKSKTSGDRDNEYGGNKAKKINLSKDNDKRHVHPKGRLEKINPDVVFVKKVPQHLCDILRHRNETKSIENKKLKD